MRNRFGGSCYRCGLWVAPGTGYFEKRRDGPGFRVQHAYTASDGGVTCEMSAKGQGPVSHKRGGKKP